MGTVCKPHLQLMSSTMYIHRQESVGGVNFRVEPIKVRFYLFIVIYRKGLTLVGLGLG